MLAIGTKGNGVFPGLQLARKFHVPLEGVVVEPPNISLLAVSHLLAVDIQPALVEQTGEHEAQVAGDLVGRQFDLRTVPQVSDVALAIRMPCDWA